MLDFAIRYLHILKTTLSGLNLTNILEQDEFYNKQILDSINPYLQSEAFRSAVQAHRLVVDVGFGGGFPILPLAKLLPEIQFVGVESRRKKVDAVQLIAQELGLSNVRLIHSRLEDLLIDRDATVTFKAVGTVQDFLPKLNSTKPLKVFFYKGPGYESTEATPAAALPGWRQFHMQDIEVPLTEKRLLVGFSGQNVPRGTVKNLVKLSQFL
jgi:16S rRNA (guanine527-N7)-methyltransferase